MDNQGPKQTSPVPTCTFSSRFLTALQAGGFNNSPGEWCHRFLLFPSLGLSAAGNLKIDGNWAIQ